MFSRDQFSNKVAIVTGGGTGLGKQTSKRLAEHGAKVILASNDVSSIIETEAEIKKEGGHALAIETDVSNQISVRNMVNKVYDKYGQLDILINSAAIYPSKPFEEVSVEEWDEVFAVNSRGYFICAKEVLDKMKAKGWGRIINISSITYFLGFENLIHYVSTKGAAIGFTRALAREVGRYGITVNSVAPGAFPTDAEKIHPDQEGYNRKILENQCIKRRGTPDDIAYTIMFFASNESDFITGQNLLVDGGWAMD